MDCVLTVSVSSNERTNVNDKRDLLFVLKYVNLFSVKMVADICESE